MFKHFIMIFILCLRVALEFRLIDFLLQLQLTCHKLEGGILQPHFPEPATNEEPSSARADEEPAITLANTVATPASNVSVVPVPEHTLGRQSEVKNEPNSLQKITANQTDNSNVSETDEIEVKAAVSNAELVHETDRNVLPGAPRPSIEPLLVTPVETSTSDPDTVDDRTIAAGASLRINLAADVSSHLPTKLIVAAPKTAFAAFDTVTGKGASETSQPSATISSSASTISAETMFSVEDKMVLLHRIVVEAVNRWNQLVSH